MKLSDCTFGRLVITTTEKEVGHIVGLTYNVALERTGNMDADELLGRTVPVVRFPRGERPIHPSNLAPF